MNEEPTNETTTETAAPANPFQCDKCGEPFANPLGLRVHKQRKHGSPEAMAKWNRNIAKAQTPDLRAKISKTRVAKSRKQSREDKLAKMREYSAQRRAERKAAKSVAPKMTTEAKREYQAKYRAKRKAQAEENGQPGLVVQQLQPKQTGHGPATCPNYCPNCGFGLAVVSVAMTIPPNR